MRYLVSHVNYITVHFYWLIILWARDDNIGCASHDQEIHLPIPLTEILFILFVYKYVICVGQLQWLTLHSDWLAWQGGLCLYGGESFYPIFLIYWTRIASVSWCGLRNLLPLNLVSHLSNPLNAARISNRGIWQGTKLFRDIRSHEKKKLLSKSVKPTKSTYLVIYLAIFRNVPKKETFSFICTQLK